MDKYTIHIADHTQEKLSEMIDYCLDNNLSLIKFECFDLSDISMTCDTITSFEFGLAEDATAFTLKYKYK